MQAGIKALVTFTYFIENHYKKRKCVFSLFLHDAFYHFQELHFLILASDGISIFVYIMHLFIYIMHITHQHSEKNLVELRKLLVGTVKLIS